MARAEYLFKLFSDFFKIHPSLVNPSSPIDSRFADYLFGCMVKRLPKEEAKLHTGDSSFLLVLTTVVLSGVVTVYIWLSYFRKAGLPRNVIMDNEVIENFQALVFFEML